jgi:hypothetical protein
MVDIYCGMQPMRPTLGKGHIFAESDDEASNEEVRSNNTGRLNQSDAINPVDANPTISSTANTTPSNGGFKFSNKHSPTFGLQSDLLTSLRQLVMQAPSNSSSSEDPFHDTCLELSRWQVEEQIRHHEEQRIHHVNMKALLTNYKEKICRLQEDRTRAKAEGTELRASLMNLISQFSPPQEGSRGKEH